MNRGVRYNYLVIKYSDLNENQQIAVTDDAKHIRVIAGAGSGKTRVLVERIMTCMIFRRKAGGKC